MDASSITTPDGRTVVRIKDNSGDPGHFTSNAISVRGMSEFQEVISIPLTRDDQASPPRPSFVRGQILLTAQEVATPAASSYVLCDVQVVGYVGASSTVIARAQLGGLQQSRRVTFQEDDTFDRIGIEARQIVDGLPSSATTGVVEKLEMSAVAVMWS